MSKKMKGVTFDDDVRARFKYQTLVQDYLELQQVRIFLIFLYFF